MREKIQSAALRRFVYVSVLWIFFPENTLGDGPKKPRIRVKVLKGVVLRKLSDLETKNFIIYSIFPTILMANLTLKFEIIRFETFTAFTSLYFVNLAVFQKLAILIN